MQSKIENLLNVLGAIEKVDYIKAKQYLTNGEPQELVKEAVRLADEVLITSEGKPNYESISYLKEHGFNVFAGEKDSFGWLTGCIRTSKGIIVFG
ncbi:hypothetical protein D2A34_14370 [Clostridium chromiireducens]|uniref:Uncharacterized protein n=1 Tax=Clostridium chromiireducens TaxID=225345 RepID=A0A399IU23_9CLOT|nr:hypothetical protein [Clostridium chromiireducens]RII34326.1 hypothetical protein D2A34_14370 [Clostridium chromiireducens]